jgi:CheY-like chemotaxis protein
MIRIFSLDDELEIIDLLHRILKPAGYAFLGTTNSQEAFTILHTQPIDLFTQDFMRPDTNGSEFLRLMKSDECLRDIPVLAITAGAREVRARQLKEYGLDIDEDLAGFVHKPFGPCELLDAIEAILEEQSIPLPPEHVRIRDRVRPANNSVHGRAAAQHGVLRN